MVEGVKVIFWDFDGVLMESNAVRDFGFERVLNDFPKEQVDQLLAFHRANGGLSRYVKFRYFFETIRNEQVSVEKLMSLSEQFSLIMKELLVNSELLIHDTLNFIKENHRRFIMHITSGSDQDELRFLCESLKINHYFSSIHGSPTPKIQLIKELIDKRGYNSLSCLLVGDSINDLEAAEVNKTKFLPYNNIKLAFETYKYL